ncbi:winged helix-turn-helix domain-containing protein [Vibrio maerlii]|uniref:winged helix-turn-helix domain-containing protein n=1 Tax=Vibrio maerlii TaxID=2231648 RepID=UPI000E3E2698|nr:winged helix-turn-helix domain-containing protein [Vibrio maerlii]
MLLINDKYIFNALTGILEERDSGVKVSLGGNEVAFLQMMINHPKEPLSKTQLLEEVWFSKGVVVEESSLLNTVSTVRKALNDRGGEIITTIRGVGYQFNGRVEEFDERADKQASKQAINYPNPLATKRNNLAYLGAFTASALLAFFAYTSLSSPWVSADFSEERYIGCVVPTDNPDKPIVLNNVRSFSTGDQVILVANNGESVSYVPSQLEVNCE